MTKAEAHRLLDAATRGEDVSQLEILAALRATGDLAPLRIFGRRDVEGGEPCETDARAPAHLSEAA